ncbi:MAG TPA: hypothetical protein VK194_03800, partial [Candidatus Deferrimicrobium sp.]|nr:hypothetical protein [Candidatus Deferrimicrobium sp.]
RDPMGRGADHCLSYWSDLDDRSAVRGPVRIARTGLVSHTDGRAGIAVGGVPDHRPRTRAA